MILGDLVIMRRDYVAVVINVTSTLFNGALVRKEEIVEISSTSQTILA